MKRPFLALLVSMIALLVVPSFWEENFLGGLPVMVLFSSVMLAGIWSAAEDRRVFRFGLVLLIPTLAARWYVFVDPVAAAFLASSFTTLIFLLFTTAVVLAAVLRERQISLDTISGGISVYFLLGVAWAVAYGMLEVIHPGSFPVREDGMELGSALRHGWLNDLLYLSFVTLSTLGYGDLTPLTRPARVLATLEAIVGQLFIAIFIARLVGMHIAQGPSDE